MEEGFQSRLIEAAGMAERDPGFKIEIVGQNFRITYTFMTGTRGYVHENLTSFRAVEHVVHNPLLMAMNDLKASSDRWKKYDHVEEFGG